MKFCKEYKIRLLSLCSFALCHVLAIGSHLKSKNHQDNNSTDGTSCGSNGMYENGTSCRMDPYSHDYHRPRSDALVGITVGALAWMCATCCVSIILGIRVAPAVGGSSTADGDTFASNDDNTVASTIQDTDEEKIHDVDCNDLEKSAYRDYTQQPTEEFEASSNAEEDEGI